MLFRAILLLIIGAILSAFGWIIWKREKITLLHSYHYDKVSEADKKLYTALMGKGLIIIGTGIALTEIIDFITKTHSGWIAFSVCFICGSGFMIYAVKKYNR